MKKNIIYLIIIVVIIGAGIWAISKINNKPCLIKGNINSSKERIYHTSNCMSYEKTQIDESKGERWFCSEQEAINAGWRKATNCN